MPLSLIPTLLISIVALEHLYIMYLETFATASKKTSETFGVSTQELRTPTISILLKNQGIYNGMLALGLIYSLFFASAPLEMVTVFLFIIVAVAFYGSFTSSKSIIFKQGGPAILALLSLLLFN
ncbi:DUF1304 domain-containing protein [uncultured Enterococcus sp.]|uniref:DUF1304 domain-containing protein n=1 Tax=uncultured Enterococcus sp. TaxID=167972 RepID=UPI002AA82E9C|nr:DUF1304 domain-containing protein [uncultured Enterococcus sp.]